MAGEAVLILKAIIDDYADKMAKMQAMNDKLMSQVGQLVKQTQKGSEEEIAMGRAAKRVLDEIRTPAERYAQQMRELNLLLSKGKLTQEEYGRAAVKARDGMQPPSGAGVQGWVQGQLGSLMSLAAGYLSVHSAIQLVMNIQREQEEQQRKAKDQAVTVGVAQANVVRNMGKVTMEEQQRFFQDIEAMAGRIQIKGGRETLTKMAAVGLSASAGDRARTLAAMEQAAKLVPEDPEAATTMTGALLGISKATGTTDMARNAGLILQTGVQSRVVEPQKIAEHLVPGIIGVRQYGGTAEEAAALVAAITQGSEDVQGRRSATAAIKLAEQLQEFLPEKDTWEWVRDAHGRLRKQAARKGTGLKTPLERIQFLQEHPKEAEQFLATRGEKLQMETKQKAAAVQLVTGQEEPFGERRGMETMTGKFYGGALKALGKPEENVALVEDTQKRLAAGFEQQARQADQAGAAGLEDLRSSIQGKKQAIQGLFSQEKLQAELSGAGAGYGTKTAAWIDWYMSVATTNEEQYKNRIRSEINYRRYGPMSQVEEARLNVQGPRADQPRVADVASQQVADLLERNLNRRLELADQLHADIAKMTVILEEQAANQKKQAAANEKQALKPSDTAVQNNRTTHREN